MPCLRDWKIEVVFTGAILFVFMFCCNIFAEVSSNIRVTNVRGTQFTVSWITTDEEIGKVRYGNNIESHESWSTANDDRGAVTADDIHHVTITNLIPNTLYFYEIILGATVDNNGGNYYSLNPGPALIPSGSCQPAGRVFKDQANTEPAYDSIVYVTILGASEGQDSATESMVVTTGTGGYWYLDLVNFRTRDYNAFYPFVCGTATIRVDAQGGNDGTCELTTQGIDYQIAERPPIVLAKNINIHLKKGFNLIAIPADVTSQPDLRDWLPVFGDSSEIEKVMVYDYLAGKFITLIPGSASNPSFTLNGGEGLIVYAKKDKDVTFTSVFCSTLDLKQGFNLVGFVCPKENYTAFQLLSDLGIENVSSIQKYATEKDGFETAGFGSADQPMGVDFPIVRGEGYFVFMKQGVLGFRF